MYQKYAMLRYASIGIVLAAVAGIVTYKRKNVFKTIKGSILEEEIKLLVKNNEKVKNVLQEKNKKNIQF